MPARHGTYTTGMALTTTPESLHTIDPVDRETVAYRIDVRDYIDGLLEMFDRAEALAQTAYGEALAARCWLDLHDFRNTI